MITVVELLTPLVRGMVLNPRQLKITERPPLNGTSVIALLPHAADYRILCGTGGRTIRALTALTALLGHQLKTPTKLQLLENHEFSQAINLPFVPVSSFDTATCIAFVKQFCAAIFDREMGMTWHRTDGKLEIRLDANVDDPKEVTSVFVLSESFYPYGYRNGCLIKIKTAKPTSKK